MSGDAAVVWLHDGTQTTPEGREEATRALLEWGRARGVHLSFEDDADPPPVRVDLSVAERVERELDRARDAIAALDADMADRALARAEATLRAHPELPEGAWLRAEVERGWAARFVRVEPRDELRAKTAWQNAQALDGGRMAGIGETDFGARSRVHATLSVSGMRGSSVDVFIDGQKHVTSSDASGRGIFELDIAPAEHQVVALVEGELAFASWIAIVPSGGAPPVVEIALSTRGSCAPSSFASVSRDSGRVRAPGVTCPSWVAASPGERRGSVLVATCARESCGPLLEWRVDRFAVKGPPQVFDARSTWPGWATWSLLGVGAATAVTITLIATGVFESRPIEPRFVSGGARVE